MKMYNCKKFTVYSLGGAVIFLIAYSYTVLNYKMLYMNNEYPMWMDVHRKINNDNDSIFNLIYIGDSRAKVGFKPNKFDTNTVKSLNLALGGATPIEGYYTLKNYLSNNKLQYLIISYAPFHLSQQDSYWNRTVKFNFLLDSDYKEIHDSALVLNDATTLGDEEYLNYKIYTGKYLIEFCKGLLFQRWNTNKHTFNYLQVSKGHYYFGRNSKATGLNKEAATKTSFKPSELINFYLDKTLELANKNNIKVFWYSMPFNESSFDAVTDVFKKEYNQYIKNLSARHKLTVLNTLFYLDNTQFSDPSHLFMGVDEVTKDIKIKFQDQI
jgi:hypothetical protein